MTLTNPLEIQQDFPGGRTWSVSGAGTDMIVVEVRQNDVSVYIQMSHDDAEALARALRFAISLGDEPICAADLTEEDS